MKRVVLVWPFDHCHSPSLSLLYQAKILNGSYDVSVVYSNQLFSSDNLSLPLEVQEEPERSLKKVASVVAKLDPDYVCIGSYRQHTPFIDRFAKQFRMQHDAALIATGYVPTFSPEEMLSLTPEIEFILRGESERSLKNLLDSLSKSQSQSEVKGLSMKKDGVFHHNPTDRIEDLDSLPLFDFEDIVGNRPKRIDIRSSLGCIMDCRFCGLHKMWPRPVRYHSEDYVLRQIKHLDSLYSMEFVHFIDEMFLCNVKRAESLAQAIHRNFPYLKWGCMFRNDTVSESVASLLKDSGLVNAAVGVESNNPKVLQFLQKTKSPSSYLAGINKNIDMLKEKLEFLELGFITGTPVETASDILSLIEFVQDIKNDRKELKDLRIALGRLVIYAGSDLYSRIGQFNMVKDEMRYSAYQKFFEAGYDRLFWAVPWNYLAENKNFRSHADYMEILSKAFEAART
ncbi:MAG: radical SAM protein [Candidatus Woesearchaeota archaeon]